MPATFAGFSLRPNVVEDWDCWSVPRRCRGNLPGLMCAGLFSRSRRVVGGGCEWN
jgi:hypothetical protein